MAMNELVEQASHQTYKFNVFVSAKEQQERAFNLSLAALLGSDIYNFGELVCFVNILLLLFHCIRDF